MDVQLEKKSTISKHKYLFALGGVFLALVIWMLVANTGAKRLRIGEDELRIVEVKHEGFQEYVESEGTTQPILTVRVTTSEAGTVARVVAEPGEMLSVGDTIVVLTNPELERTIDDERDNLEKQRVAYREKVLQMERKTSELERNVLRTRYELDKLTKKHALDREEFSMGLLSKAQLEIAEDEYNFTRENTRLMLEELRQDSLANIIQADLMASDLRREEVRFGRSVERLGKLVICAPIAGQLSFVEAIPGERVALGTALGEIRVIDDVKIGLQVSEYYMERLQIGSAATLISGDERIPMRVARITPEINAERNFKVDLHFTDRRPDNIVLGKAYRVQIELDRPVETLVVERGSFYQQTGGRWIFRLNPSGTKATRAEIRVGRQNPRQYEVLEGLEEGDRVVISGYDRFGDAQELVIK
jgi:multidrug efflux pump subunit AcrA (membrane-fusion protein)